jgi:very-short-patch-repair endonuclease
LSPTRIDPAQIARAKTLRRNMTNGEKRLWRELKDFKRHYNIHVRKQTPIGPYIADFAIHEIKLIIEVDGEHHFTEHGQMRDRTRDAWFVTQGFETLRFTTGDLDELDACINTILKHPSLQILFSK